MDAVASARACVGTRFRPQGRLPGVGLDCVGVIASATGADVPCDYDLGDRAGARVEAELGRLGFIRVDAARAGDILVVAPSDGLRHLAVVVGKDRIVHAHAGLRRVVEGPVDPAWTIVGIWRRGEG